MFHRVEFYATDSHAGGVVLVGGASLIHILTARALRNGGLVLIAEHVEVVLEHIDDFVGLKGLFDQKGHTIDETLQTCLDLRVVDLRLVL